MPQPGYKPRSRQQQSQMVSDGCFVCSCVFARVCVTVCALSRPTHTTIVLSHPCLCSWSTSSPPSLPPPLFGNPHRKRLLHLTPEQPSYPLVPSYLLCVNQEHSSVSTVGSGVDPSLWLPKLCLSLGRAGYFSPLLSCFIKSLWRAGSHPWGAAVRQRGGAYLWRQRHRHGTVPDMLT